MILPFFIDSVNFHQSKTLVEPMTLMIDSVSAHEIFCSLTNNTDSAINFYCFQPFIGYSFKVISDSVHNIYGDNCKRSKFSTEATLKRKYIKRIKSNSSIRIKISYQDCMLFVLNGVDEIGIQIKYFSIDRVYIGNNQVSDWLAKNQVWTGGITSNTLRFESLARIKSKGITFMEQK